MSLAIAQSTGLSLVDPANGSMKPLQVKDLYQSRWSPDGKNQTWSSMSRFGGPGF
jgi:hypothetical protein